MKTVAELKVAISREGAAFVVNYGGRNVYCEVSPCSWMYPGYGLQVGMSLAESACNAESMFVHDKAINCMNRPIEELAADARLLVDRELGKLEVRQKLVDVIARFAEATEKFRLKRKIEEMKLAEERARMKAKGYTHMFTGWIHPKTGDDYQVRAFTRGAPDVSELLKRSVVKTDYQVIEL